MGLGRRTAACHARIGVSRPQRAPFFLGHVEIEPRQHDASRLETGHDPQQARDRRCRRGDPRRTDEVARRRIAPPPGDGIEQAVAPFGQVDSALNRRYQGAPKAHKKVGALGQPGAVATLAPTELEPAELDGFEVPEVEAPEAPRIVKAKRFAIHPMTAEEAVDRMGLLGHGFFFFTNIETSRAAVVYRRDDGQVGLIDEAD